MRIDRPTAEASDATLTILGRSERPTMPADYPRTLDAVAKEERSSWAVAFALADEVALTAAGAARANELDRVARYLADHGYERAPSYLSTLHTLGRWAKAGGAGVANRLARHSTEMARITKGAGMSAEVAVAELDAAKAAGVGKRAFARRFGRDGEDVRDTAPTPEKAEAVVAELLDNPTTRDAVVRRVEAARREQWDAEQEAANTRRARAGMKPIVPDRDRQPSALAATFGVIAHLSAARRSITSALTDLRTHGIPDAAHDTIELWVANVRVALNELDVFVATGDDAALDAALAALVTEEGQP